MPASSNDARGKPTLRSASRLAQAAALGRTPWNIYSRRRSALWNAGSGARSRLARCRRHCRIRPGGRGSRPRRRVPRKRSFVAASLPRGGKGIWKRRATRSSSAACCATWGSSSNPRARPAPRLRHPTAPLGRQSNKIAAHHVLALLRENLAPLLPSRQRDHGGGVPAGQCSGIHAAGRRYSGSGTRRSVGRRPQRRVPPPARPARTGRGGQLVDAPGPFLISSRGRRFLRVRHGREFGRRGLSTFVGRMATTANCSGITVS
jgi:hypothetical protein